MNFSFGYWFWISFSKPAIEAGRLLPPATAPCDLVWLLSELVNQSKWKSAPTGESERRSLILYRSLRKPLRFFIVLPPQRGRRAERERDARGTLQLVKRSVCCSRALQHNRWGRSGGPEVFSSNACRPVAVRYLSSVVICPFAPLSPSSITTTGIDI